MAREGIHHKKKGIDDKKHRPKTNAEPGFDRLAVDYLVRVVKAAKRSIPEDRNEDEGDVHGEAMKVVKPERNYGLAAILPAGIAHSASGRAEEPGAVIRTPVVVAGCAERDWADKDNKRR